MPSPIRSFPQQMLSCSVVQKLVFVDIRPDTMNIDEQLIEQAITPRTKAIVPVHYAGVACEMDTIMKLALKYDLKVIEDAAQGVDASYKGRALGKLVISAVTAFMRRRITPWEKVVRFFFRRKNIWKRRKILREKGTENRSRFFRGQVDKVPLDGLWFILSSK